MAQFRNGQWVSTSLAIVGAHKTPDGRSVGVYYAPGSQPVAVKDGDKFVMRQVPVPPAVFIISAEDGQDLYAMVGREAKPVSFDPAKLPDLQPVAEAAHLHPARAKSVPDGAKLPA